MSAPLHPASIESKATDIPPGPRQTAADLEGEYTKHLAAAVQGLRAQRERWRVSQNRAIDRGPRELPSREVIETIVSDLRAALFPMRLGPANLRQDTEDFFVGHTLDTALQELRTQLALELAYSARHHRECGQVLVEDCEEMIRTRVARVLHGFIEALPAVRGELDADVMAAFHGDPAAGSVDEVLLCYPGIDAVISHRIAHRLYRLGAPLLARIIAEQAHSRTGCDIHPGARIREGFFIDHATGVVIGETAVIGRHVRLYQHVTLGAKRFPTEADGSLSKGLPRHPVVEDDVVVYAGATILGRVTIGQGSTIGGNVWLTESVPPGSNITQANAQQQR